MAADIVIREATQADLPALLQIYNQAVEHTTAIWNETVVDLANREAWFADRRSRNHPVLVAETQGLVVGYATYGSWRAIDGFRQTMEHSVYVRPDRGGMGIGSQLMRELIGVAAARGVHVLVACIEARNEASIAVHTKLGFRSVGTFLEVGRKFDRWLDLTCMELRLPSMDR